jgi:hypothetical protein
MVLGWCYVLSARLVELRGASRQDGMVYTDSKAVQITGAARISNGGYTIPIGSTDPAECRWWAAILAGEPGWHAVMFTIHHNCSTTTSSSYSPPTTMQARKYLINFAERYNAYDQLLAAFVASLTILKHGRFGASVSLPIPEAMAPAIICKTKTMAGQIPSGNQLQAFMALSCIPNALTSFMFGCLWDTRVQCNLVSEWLGPLLQENIPSLMSAGRYDIIVQIMAARKD